jgi:hypothetical protein
LFAAMQCDGSESERSEQADSNPKKVTCDFWHEGGGIR